MFKIVKESGSNVPSWIKNSKDRKFLVNDETEFIELPVPNRLNDAVNIALEKHMVPVFLVELYGAEKELKKYNGETRIVIPYDFGIEPVGFEFYKSKSKIADDNYGWERERYAHNTPYSKWKVKRFGLISPEAIFDEGKGYAKTDTYFDNLKHRDWSWINYG